MHHDSVYSENHRTNVAAILLGLNTITLQIVLLRSFFSMFQGNELTLGIGLSFWLWLNGLGSYFGKWIKWSNINIVFIFLTLIPIIALIALLILPNLFNIFFEPGELPSLLDTLLIIFILLFPVCIISGMLFSATVSVAKNPENQTIGKTYAWESIGSMIGAIVLNFILIWFFDSVQILLLILFVNSKILLWMRYGGRSDFKFIGFSFVSLVIIGTLWFLNLDQHILEWKYPNQDINFHKQTVYGELTVTHQKEQENVYNNHTIINTDKDVTANEELVHFALSQRPEASRVLFLSNNYRAAIEFHKYQIDKVDYLEINPWILQMGKRYFNENQLTFITAIEMDLRRFIQVTNNKYDVAIFNTPKPLNILLNRYFTEEFYISVKECLTDEGVVLFPIGESANYYTEHELKYYSIIYKTVESTFENVLIIPGLANYVLASDGEIDLNIAEKITDLNIQNQYVNADYIFDDLVIMRSAEINGSLNENVESNKDFRPLGFYQQMKVWLAYFNYSFWIPVLVILVLLVFTYARTEITEKAVYTAGFTASALEIMIIMAFQVLLGYAYYFMGIVFMVFMLGLAAGSFMESFVNKDPGVKRMFRLLIILLANLIVSSALILGLSRTSNESVIISGILFITILMSIITGLIFAHGGRLMKTNQQISASKIYGSDLVGSGFGALIVSIILFPKYGFVVTSIILLIFILITIGLTFLQIKKAKG